MKTNFLYFQYKDDQSQLLPCQKKMPKYKISPNKRYNRQIEMTMPLGEYRLGNSTNSSCVQQFTYLKNTCKDTRRVRDAFLVRSLPIHQKENNRQVPSKKMAFLTKPLKLQTRKTLSNMSFDFKTEVALQNELNNLKRNSKPCRPELLKFPDLDDKQPNNTVLLRAKANLKAKKEDTLHKTAENQKIDKELQGVGGSKVLPSCSKSQNLLNKKINQYLKQLKANYILYFPTQNSVYNENILTEYAEEQSNLRKKLPKIKIKKGNNSALIKWLFKKRWWWLIEEDANSGKQLVNFVWSQLKDKQYLEIKDNSGKNIAYCHNHFPFNQYLGNKKALFYHMSHYYTVSGENVFDYLPLTYHVTSLSDNSWADFVIMYAENQRKGQNNVWIIKPGENSNRGRGIQVCEDLTEIKQMVATINSPTLDNPKQLKNSYILQKYIEKPFLYNQRKFDIRAYMLLANINNTLKGFWYPQGYIRTSSFEYQLNDLNSFVHLTNDAIQNNSQSYGKYECGNKLSYAQFQKYLDNKYQGEYNIVEQIVPQMKKIAMQSLKATRHLLRGKGLNIPVFEVFGLDFMIDSQFKPWLIQINTNPCLETSCSVLQRIIPKMLDDAFKLTVDVLFPPPQNWPSSKKHLAPSPGNRFQLIFQQSQCKVQPEKSEQIISLDNITEDQQLFQEPQK